MIVMIIIMIVCLKNNQSKKSLQGVEALREVSSGLSVPAHIGTVNSDLIKIWKRVQISKQDKY